MTEESSATLPLFPGDYTKAYEAPSLAILKQDSYAPGTETCNLPTSLFKTVEISTKKPASKKKKNNELAGQKLITFGNKKKMPSKKLPEKIEEEVTFSRNNKNMADINTSEETCEEAKKWKEKILAEEPEAARSPSGFSDEEKSISIHESGNSSLQE